MLDDQRTTSASPSARRAARACTATRRTRSAYREAGPTRGAPRCTHGDAFASVTGRRSSSLKGFEDVCKLPYAEATALVAHPVACIDCHAPENMSLRVTKPGFLRGIEALARSDVPLPHLPSIERWRGGERAQPYYPNRDASRQELRSMVCGSATSSTTAARRRPCSSRGTRA
jgi:nitrite reductase (cytochrome c-552)